MNVADIPRKSAHVLARKAPDSLLLLDPESGRYYTLDEVGARIWELCDGDQSIADIVSRLCDEYDAQPADVESDTRELLDELVRERLVVSGTGAR
jgi:Coenzyme PQQ synthesis protein D (PqqD)